MINLHGPGGYKLYSEVIDKCAIISTGIENFDKLLDGGFITGNIYELCGSVGSGKTQICMTLAVNVCNNLPEQSVLYIDTKNDVSGHRILEIIENSERNIENAGELMNRIKICRALKATELLSLLQKLTKDLDEAEGRTLGFRIIIIDSLSCLFFRFLGADWNEGLVLLNNLASLLHFIAVEYHIAILVTNLVTSWTVDDVNDEEEELFPEQKQTPVLGRYWAHVPDTRINVKKMENANNWLLVIMKSTTQAFGKTANVTLTKSGAV
ncbi:UNVERIFIED_CONTAM: hypothetical protein PYX00_007198 [Menopon gallinae]|uniref:RecA family profile 1 domain-containing protein n=1 Tax=Menopon gallinae TaxID=328185 RepID=A0AAW2HI77_9NEOP